MEVKVWSRETIVPSSPTPSHLKTFQLSLFDQMSPLVYTPLSFFYHKNNQNNDHPHQNHEQLIATLKTSLSKTLTQFFLLAGRIVDTSICCGDNELGAIFIEASVNRTMSEVLQEPNHEVLLKLLPCSAICTDPVEEYVQIIVQVNEFMCGGIAISVCLLHKLMDAASLSCFLRSWASINRGCTPLDSSSNNYKLLSSLFPQTNLLPFHPRVADQPQPFSNPEEKRYCQRVVFTAKAISDLKAKVAKSSNVSNPTCVEVLTSFISKHVWQAMSTRTGGSSQGPHALTHVVNLRKRSMEPKLSEFDVGNLVWIVIAPYSQNENNEQEVEIGEVVSLLRQTFDEVDQSYIQKMVGREGSEAAVKIVKETGKLLNQTPNVCMFTSWRNMDFDQVDFGWGKPTWIGIASDSWTAIRGKLVVFMDTMSGDGVEAWITLEDQDMKLLVQNPQFLEFAVMNPTIPLL